MDSLHKKPYELVVIGQFTGDVLEPQMTATSHNPKNQDICEAPPSPKKLCLDTEFLIPNDTLCASECTSEEEPTLSNSASIVQRACCGTGVITSCGSSCNTICDTTHRGCSPRNYISMPELCEPFAFVCVASLTHSQKPYLGGGFH